MSSERANKWEGANKWWCWLRAGKINFSSHSLKLDSWEVHTHVRIHVTKLLVSKSLRWPHAGLSSGGSNFKASPFRQLFAPQLLPPPQLKGGRCCSQGTGAAGLEQRVTFTLSLRAVSSRLGQGECRGWGVPRCCGCSPVRGSGCRRRSDALQQVCKARRTTLVLQPLPCLFRRGWARRGPLKHKECLPGPPYGSEY